MAQVLAVSAAAVLLLLVVLLLVGWGGLLNLGQRLGLGSFASGFILAAPERFRGEPAGWLDLMWIAGLGLYFAATYLGKIIAHVDGLDGAIDGRARIGPITVDGEAIRHAMALDRRRRIQS